MAQCPPLDTQAGRRVAAVELVALSAVVLFQELTLIRWLPSQVRVLAYYPNLVMIASFLGLGLGCLRAGRRPLLVAWPIALVVMVAAASALSTVVFTQSGTSEHLFLLYYDLPRTAPVVNDIRGPLLLAFVLTAACFVSPGQLVAERLQAFRGWGAPLAGYTWDLVGSLVGIAAFTAASFRGLFPVTWFAAVLLVGLLFFRHRWSSLLGYAAAGALLLWIVAHAEKAQRYSPYYAIRVEPRAAGPGLSILANGSLHQNAVP